MLSLAATGTCCFIISVMSWIYMLKPATVYDYDDDQENTLENDPLLVLIGGFIMLTFTPFTLGESWQGWFRKDGSGKDAGHGAVVCC